MAFNPDEPRDEHGRWTGGGGGSVSSKSWLIAGAGAAAGAAAGGALGFGLGGGPAGALVGGKYGAEIGGVVGAFASGHPKEMQAVLDRKIKGAAGAALSSAAEGEQKIEGAIQATGNVLGVGDHTAAALDKSHEEVSAALHSQAAQSAGHWIKENGAFVAGGIGLASAFLGHPLGFVKAGAIGADAGAGVGTAVGILKEHNSSRAFDSSEARDDHGRWTAMGEAVDTALKSPGHALVDTGKSFIKSSLATFIGGSLGALAGSAIGFETGGVFGAISGAKIGVTAGTAGALVLTGHVGLTVGGFLGKQLGYAGLGIPGAIVAGVGGAVIGNAIDKAK